MKKVKIIDKCPACNSLLERVNDQLFCRNIDCISQNIKKVEKFAKGLKIKGLGPKTIEKLNIDYIPKIYNLCYNEVEDILGKKLSDKLREEIEHSKNTDFFTVLGCLSIPLVGKQVANKLKPYVTKLDDIDLPLCNRVKLGDKTTKSLLTWLDNNKSIFKELPTYSFNSSSSSKKEVRFICCITGKLNDYSSRAKAIEVLESKGVEVKSTVSKKVDYLICDIENSTSSSITKAIRYEIPIVTMKTFLKEISNNE